MSIEARHISKRFGEFKALDDVTLDVPQGELVALLGPSGCGKTTLLRIIAGLEMPDAGSVLFYGEDTTSKPAKERQVGFVFQHYALFRHMTVFENVAFGLRVRPHRLRPPAAEIRRRVNALLQLIQMESLAGRYPNQLSGGQRQRVALARSLAVEPKVLLLDEPFGALDTKVRKELRRWLRRLHDEIHVSSVFVTHDQEEALEVADRIVVMNRGRIEQIGTPDEVHESPATAFVYNFLGNVNLFHGRVHDGWAHVGDFRFPAPEHNGANQQPAVAYVRPHEIDLERTADGDGLPAVIVQIRAMGPVVRIELRQAQGEEIIEVEFPRERHLAEKFTVGERVYLKPRKMRVFLRNDQRG